MAKRKTATKKVVVTARTILRGAMTECKCAIAGECSEADRNGIEALNCMLAGVVRDLDNAKESG